MRWALCWSCIVGRVVGRASNSEMEAKIREVYVDQEQVSLRTVEIKGGLVEYLEAGEGKTVLFCHGAAFSMHTWQYVGVLDALATAGYRAIAINLPGYGRTTGGVAKDAFLETFARALQLPRSLVVVAASMGGSYAFPFVYSGTRAVGYVTVAGVLPSRLPTLAAPPILGIYGSDDPRLAYDRSKFGSNFQNADLVVFRDAPHPCYLRDLDAAAQFTDLVLTFVGASDAVSDLRLRAAWGGDE